MAYIDTYSANAQQTIKALAGIFKSATTADLIVTANNYYAAGGTAAGLYDLLLNAYSTTTGFTNYAATASNADFATALITNLCAGTTITAEVQTVWATNVAAALPAFATRGAAMVALMDLINAQTTGDLATLKAVVANRSEVGAFYAQHAAGTTYSSIAQLNAVETLVTDNPSSITTAEQNIPGSTYTMTTGTDVFSLTSANDTVTGVAGTLQDGDIVNDALTTDNDTATLVQSGAAVNPTITNVENITVNFALGASGINVNKITGDKIITLGSAEAGSTSATVTGIKTGKSFDLSTALSTLSLTTNSTTATTEAVTLKMNGKAVTLTTSATSDIDQLTINSTGGSNTLTFATATDIYSSTGESITVKGDQNLTLKTGATAASNGFDGATINKDSSYTGSLTVEYTGAVAGSQNLSKIAADTFKFSGTPTTGTITLNSGTTSVLAAGDIDALTAIAANATNSTLNFTVTASQAAGTNQLNNFSTVNVSTAGATSAITINALVLGQASTLDSAAVTVAGDQNLTLSSVTAKTLDATGFTKKLTISTTAQAMTITGGDGNDNITTGAFASSVAGGAGNDTLTTGNAASTIAGGEGNDTISLAAVTGNKAAAVTGDAGDDTITLGVASTTSSYDGGAGNDGFTVSAATKLVGSVIGGDGTDTVTFSAAAAYNVSGNTFSLATVEVINVSATNALSTFKGSQLTGKTLNVAGAGTNDTVLVKAAATGTAESIDLSGINHSVQTMTLTGSTLADILKGTKGADTINLSAASGANQAAADIVTGGDGYDTFVSVGNTYGVAGGSVTAYTAAMNITDFYVGSAAATTDLLKFSSSDSDFSAAKGGPAAVTGLSDGAGDVGSGDAAVVKTVAKDAAATAIGGTDNFIKLSTATAFTTDLKTTVAAAFGTASLTSAGIDKNYLGSYYDSTNSKMVLFVINSGANVATDTTISAADATAYGVQLVGTVDMTSTAYASFAAANIAAFL